MPNKNQKPRRNNNNKKKKPNAQKPKQKPRKTARKPKLNAPRIRMPVCTQKYMQAMVNPFGAVQGACVPTYPSRPSQKHRAYISIDGAIGTAGVGFVLAGPCYDNTTNSIWYSSAAFPGTIMAQAGTGVTATPVTNNPYTPAQLAVGDAHCRTVGWGMRIVYTGTELNRSGMTTCCVHPDHLSLSGYGSSDLLAFGDQVTRTDPVHREWCMVVTTPTQPSDFEYSTAPYSQGSSITPFAAIMISGVPGSTFRIQVYHHFEAIGKLATSPTNNDIDPNGTQLVVSSVQKALSNPNVKPKSWFTKALEFYKEHISPVVTAVAPTLLKLIP